MSVQAFWDDEEQTIIRFLYRRSNWEWHDFYAAMEQARMLANSVNHPVGFVLDISYGGLTPGIFMSQAKILHEFRRHPAVSLFIVIGADRFIEALYQVSATNIPLNDQYYFARTLEDAYVILGEVNKESRAIGDYW